MAQDIELGSPDDENLEPIEEGNDDDDGSTGVYYHDDPESVTASTLEVVAAWSTTHLINIVEGLRKTVNHLKKENQLLAAFALHVLPESTPDGTIVGVPSSVPTLGSLQAPPSTTAEDAGSSSPSGGRRRSRSSRTSTDHQGSIEIAMILTLTTQQKLEIAHSEVDLMREKLREQRERCQGIVIDYNVQLEEALLAEDDLKRSKEAFHRVVEKAPNPTTGVIMAEKVGKYFELSIKTLDTATERYRLSNTILGVAIKKLHNQIRQKEELGDKMREVDYNQLKIENAQYQEKLDERNHAMLKVKHIMSVTLQLLGHHNAKLQQLMSQSSQLSTDINQRTEALTKVATEIQAAEEERDKTCRQVKQMKEQLDNFRVVDVMDYIHKQAELYDLKKDVTAWERKVNIMRKSVRVQSFVEKRARKAAQAVYHDVKFDEIEEQYSS